MWRDEVADVRKRLRGAAILLSVAAAACASRNPAPVFAYDHAASFVGLKTWAWLDDPAPQMPPGNAIVDSQFIDRSVRQDVGEVLSGKGFDATESGQADIYLAYQMDNAGVLSQDTFEKTKKTDFLLWSWDHLEYSGTQYSKRSALVLDIRDREKKLAGEEPERRRRAPVRRRSPGESRRRWVFSSPISLPGPRFRRWSKSPADPEPGLNPRIGKGGPD